MSPFEITQEKKDLAEIHALRLRVRALERQLEDAKTYRRRYNAKRASDVPAQLAFMGKRAKELEMLSGVPCVYFLIKDGSLSYIGKSISVQGRIANHYTYWEFDRVLYLVAPQRFDLEDVENALISHFNPPLNRKFVRPARSKQILAALGVDVSSALAPCRIELGRDTDGRSSTKTGAV